MSLNPIKNYVAFLLLMGLVQFAWAQEKILISNAEIFTGKSPELISGYVLVEGNSIAEVSPGSYSGDASSITRHIDAGGRFLMPGMIDAHWHTLFAANTMAELLGADDILLALKATKEAEATLMRGFTTVRDIGGPIFGIKTAIDAGLFPGPRIYPAGAMISQTSGHADFRLPHERARMATRTLPRAEEAYAGIVADGPYEVTVAVREQLRKGASQIKITVGGGVSTIYDPLDVMQYSVEEIEAAVNAAKDWGTYVAAHVYTSEGVRRAVESGVRSIEHANLLDEETVKFIAGYEDVWICITPFGVGPGNPPGTPQQEAERKLIAQGTANLYIWAKKYGLKNIAWGSDVLFNPQNTKNQSLMIAGLTPWLSSFEILKMITYDNAQLLAMSGKRNPYQYKLGVIENGAYADILLFNGNLLENIGLVENPQENIHLIMKNGKVLKNTLNKD